MKKIELLLIFSIITFISIFSFSNEINMLRMIFLFRRIQYKIKAPKDSIFSLSVKNIVPCPKDSLNLAYFGQSNHGNNIKRNNNLIINNENIFMYDWRTNLCSQYKEPLAGPDGRRGFGHIATDNINSLLKKYSYKGKILVMGFSKGGSIAEQWAKGELFNSLDLILERLKNKKIKIDYVFWHQGESENKNPSEKYLNQYKKDLKFVFQKFFDNYPDIYIGMALVSRCNSQRSKSLLDIQRSIIKDDKRIFLTLNTDNLGNDFRYDNCHFNWLGSKRIGEDYSDLIHKLNY